MTMCSKFALTMLRYDFWLTHSPWARRPVLGKSLIFFNHVGHFLTVVLCKITIQEMAVIGKNIWLSPKGNIIIGAERIGDNCRIHHNVTLGTGLGSGMIEGGMIGGGKPTIGNNVWIGPNSVIHGKIKIGSGVTVLGGSVLSKNIAENCVVSGNPARIIARNYDNTELLSKTDHDISPDAF